MLTEAELLAAWEGGHRLDPVRRALSLAVAAGADRASVADLGIGSRDVLVLGLRERCFGEVYPCAVTCPACAEELELELDAAQLRTGPGGTRRVEVDGFDVELRPLTSRDLLELPATADPRGWLVRRCVAGDADLPDRVLGRLAAELSTCDPQADLMIELDCAGCGHEWRSPFDAAAYLWGEIDVYARRLLLDVHTLAAAYGWSEDEVLAVPPARRRFYIEMAGT
ncbi:hypothetical protein [Amycolatopsis suaedae]|uniref:Phage baseplate protein n=1 Tax=Amycolatopsis suaedae TaxID=2510978 RepID=A0A4Q7IZ32_9PSEU|nr:hypothetical protein [Amycolatopsis suaedae]RZQ59323.1 hypothetical protein EWH70_34615 [Amycolatopsis suaedae]